MCIGWFLSIVSDCLFYDVSSSIVVFVSILNLAGDAFILSSVRKVLPMSLCTFRVVVVAWPFALALTARSQP